MGNTTSQFHLELGQDWFKDLDFSTPNPNDLPKAPTGGGEDSVKTGKFGSFIKAFLADLATKFTHWDSLLGDYEKKLSDWREGASAYIEARSAPFLEWAETQIPTDASLKFATDNGEVLTLPDGRKAVVDCAAFWLTQLGKLSNQALRGNPAKKGKPSLFDNHSKGKQIGGFFIANSEIIKGGASIRYSAEDADGKIRAAILEINDAANCFVQNRLADAGAIILKLTDLDEDKRFGFDDGMVKGLIQARIYGLYVAATTQAIKELKDGKEAYLRNAAEEADKERILLQRQQAEQAEEIAMTATA